MLTAVFPGGFNNKDSQASDSLNKDEHSCARYPVLSLSLSLSHNFISIQKIGA